MRSYQVVMRLCVAAKDGDEAERLARLVFAAADPDPSWGIELEDVDVAGWMPSRDPSHAGASDG